MSGDIDPLPGKTARLADALTTTRFRAQSRDGAIVVEASARGAIRLQVNDSACRSGGAELSRVLNELIEQAVAAAQENVATVLADFRSDPRVSDGITRTEDALHDPVPPPLTRESDSRSAGSAGVAASPVQNFQSQQPFSTSAPSSVGKQTWVQAPRHTSSQPDTRDRHIAARRRAQEEFDRELEYQREVEENEEFLRRTLGGDR